MKAMNQAVPESKRVLELNPDHQIVKVMSGMYTENNTDPRLSDYADLLYDQALLTEGSAIKDPLKFTRLISELMVKAAKSPVPSDL
jgi:molecular chaperone HtpG